MGSSECKKCNSKCSNFGCNFHEEKKPFECKAYVSLLQ